MSSRLKRTKKRINTMQAKDYIGFKLWFEQKPFLQRVKIGLRYIFKKELTWGKEVVILGKGPQWSEEFKSYCQTHSENDYEVWTVGTHPFPRASRYYEFHGLSYEASPMREYIRESPSEVYTMGVPVNNSVIVMMLIAYLEGAASVTLLGCPMNIREEYISELPAVAECVGFLRGKGLNVFWSDEPKNEKYGLAL